MTALTTAPGQSVATTVRAPGPATAELSVVLCAYTADRWGDLVAALAALAAQEAPPGEVLVVVDHHPELLARVVGHLATGGAGVPPGTRAVASAGAPGLSGARNTGAAAALGAIVAFVDDDARPASDWSRRLMSHYAHPLVIGVGGAIVPDWDGGRPRWFPVEFDWVVGCTYRGSPRRVAPVRNLIGANMSLRRAALARVGGFREDLGRVGNLPLGCEETELCLRATLAIPGGIFLHDPTARVAHRVTRARATPGYFLRRCWAEGRSKAAVVALAGGARALSTERAYTLRTLPGGAARGLLDLAGHRDIGGVGRAFAIVAGLTTTVAGYLRGRLAARRAAGSPALAVPATAPRVLLVTARYPPYAGGTETHVAEVARRLARRRPGAVAVLTTDPGGCLDAAQLDGGVGLVVLRARAWPGRGPLGDLHLAPGLIAAIARERQRRDLLHLQGYHTLVAPLALLVATVARLPYVVSFHSGGPDDADRGVSVRGAVLRAQRAIMRPLLLRARALIAVSTFEADHLADRLRLPRARFVVIPSGLALPPPVATPTPPTAGVLDGPLIVSPGRLEGYKGHRRVIAALPYVLAREPGARVRIAGAGADAEGLRRLADWLGVGSRVAIAAVPIDDRAGMAALLDAAAVVAVLSEWESQGLAAGEAIARGRPTVVLDASALAELVARGLARGVPIDAGPEEIAAALLAALAAPPPPPAARSLLPTWDGCVDALEALYVAAHTGAPVALGRA